MLAFATIDAIKGLVGALTEVLEDPDTYKKLAALRNFLSEVTGKEIPEGAFLKLLEESTQGEGYDGEWEVIDDNSSRLRVAGGFIYVIYARPIFVAD